MDLGFATDGLYSAGWWPGEGDGCVRARDGRWIPSEDTVLKACEQARWVVSVAPTEPGHATRVRWHGADGSTGEAVSINPAAAWVMLMTEIVRRERATIASG